MAKDVNRRKFMSFLASVGASAFAAACKVTGKAHILSSQILAEDDFDYIVVGSGAGGGPLAVNLSRAGFRTLLIEAGNDQGRREVYQIPAFHPIASEDPEMSWDFYVKHFDSGAKDQEDGKFVENKGILYPRAGTLGGCTSHNAMISVYPNASDWDKMGEDVGDASYNGSTMRKYFSFVENATYQTDPNRKKGWLQIRFASSFLIIGDHAVKAMLFSAARMMNLRPFKNIRSALNLLNLVTISDTNSLDPARDTSEGLLLVPLAVTDKFRRRCVRDYVVENANPNLILRTNCHVTKLTFDEGAAVGSGPVVTGVEYEMGEKLYKAAKDPQNSTGQKKYAKARREVILAGGTFNTPQILMLSGIGPKADLDALAQSNGDYRVRLDLPGVGKNMQDRYELGVVNRSDKPLDLVKDCKFAINVVDPCFSSWKDSAEGAYTSNGGVVAILKKSKPELVNPDLFIFMLPSDFRGYAPGYSKVIANSKSFTTWAILKAHTHNRGGSVKLKTLNPFDMPEINFRYYEDGTTASDEAIGGNMSTPVDDLEAMVTGIEFVRKLMTDANSVYDYTSLSVDDLPEIIGIPKFPYFQEVAPGSHLDTRPRLREWARRNSWGHHACGTCKMGESSDPMAVVDSKFKVIGAKNLRVVDASIFPRIPGYFIVSSIYTISERATDEILADAGVARRVQI
jgi:choline dehydrogenase